MNSRVPLMSISIHTTAKVVTISQSLGFSLDYDFNPHHREGGDKSIAAVEKAFQISIHTTAKVVTG